MANGNGNGNGNGKYIKRSNTATSQDSSWDVVLEDAILNLQIALETARKVNTDMAEEEQRAILQDFYETVMRTEHVLTKVMQLRHQMILDFTIINVALFGTEAEHYTNLMQAYFKSL